MVGGDQNRIVLAGSLVFGSGAPFFHFLRLFADDLLQASVPFLGRLNLFS
jgi:hypothetical protein